MPRDLRHVQDPLGRASTARAWDMAGMWGRVEDPFFPKTPLLNSPYYLDWVGGRVGQSKNKPTSRFFASQMQIIESRLADASFSESGVAVCVALLSGGVRLPFSLASGVDFVFFFVVKCIGG